MKQELLTYEQAIKAPGVYQVIGGNSHDGDFLVVDKFSFKFGHDPIYINMHGQPPYALGMSNCSRSHFKNKRKYLKTNKVFKFSVDMKLILMETDEN